MPKSLDITVMSRRFCFRLVYSQLFNQKKKVDLNVTSWHLMFIHIVMRRCSSAGQGLSALLLRFLDHSVQIVWRLQLGRAGPEIQSLALLSPAIASPLESVHFLQVSK